VHHQDRRELSLSAAIAVVTGESVALGIFLTPAAMARSLGSTLLLALVWCGLGLMALSGALCYTELAVRYPASGGEYVYLRHGFGDTAAFVYGWMSSVVMYPGVAAALAVGAAAYIYALLPTAKLTGSWVPAALLIAFGGVQILGTRFSSRVMAGLNVLKFTVLFGLVGWVAVSGHGRISNLIPFASRVPASEPWLGALAGAVMSGFFSFGGWWEAGKLAGEVRNPERNLPIAFVGGVLLVTTVYLAISFAFVSVVPIAGMSSGIAFVSQFGQALFGSAGARLLAGCVLLCVGGGLAALMMAAPRVTFAMAQTGQFLPLFGRLHPRFGTPANAILLQTGLALVALLFGTFDRILAYIIFSAVLFLGLTVATLFRVTPRPQGWWFPAAPILFLVFCAVVALLLLLRAPVPALFGVLIVLIGLPLHRGLRRRRSASPVLASERI
jgi:APA family basic amino acid/polyamine antiporter